MPSKTENMTAFDAVLEALRSAGIDAEEGASHDIDFRLDGREWHIDIGAGRDGGQTAL